MRIGGFGPPDFRGMLNKSERTQSLAIGMTIRAPGETMKTMHDYDVSEEPPEDAPLKEIHAITKRSGITGR